MKILYAVQATGNGHIARAMELMPYLQQYGEVDVFLSGNNSDLEVELPVKYRSKGLSLFYHKKGGLDYWKILKELNLSRVYHFAKQLPVEEYDIVINDFESITAQACKIKKIPSVNFGHQASFQSSKVPRPGKKDLIGEWILKNYAFASSYVGLHFEQYDNFIFNPVIKEPILKAEPKNKGHITVYLSHYADETVAAQISKIRDMRFEIFSKKEKNIRVENNITYIPISNETFNRSMINCAGIITGAGFETPAEALYLGKKLLCLPIKGQYEQLCNAEALKSFNVPIINTIDDYFSSQIMKWMGDSNPKKLFLNHSTGQIVNHVIETAIRLKKTAPADTKEFAG